MTIDRKALTRQYKETPRAMGVGVVRNLANGKVFVISGRDIRSLLNRHLAELKIKAHKGHALQSDFNEHGADGFAFEIVDTLTPKDVPGYNPTDDLAALEELWIERLSATEPDGYNPRSG